MTVRKTDKCFRLKRNKHRDGFHPLLSLCQYCLSNVLVTSQLPLCFCLSRLRHRHPHSQMHYWKNKLLSLPCCELCWVMSESLSPPDSCRASASYFFYHLVFNSDLLSICSCFVSPLLYPSLWPFLLYSSSFFLLLDFSSFTSIKLRHWHMLT